MGKFNNLDEMKIADLNEAQMEMLASVENKINQQNNQDDEVYLIAFHRPKNNDQS